MSKKYKEKQQKSANKNHLESNKMIGPTNTPLISHAEFEMLKDMTRSEILTEETPAIVQKTTEEIIEIAQDVIYSNWKILSKKDSRKTIFAKIMKEKLLEKEEKDNAT